MKHSKIFIPVLLLLSVSLFFVFSGCGKKGPPLPPEIKGESITAPFDLQYKLDKSTITLTWKHEINKETAFIKPESFEIFMAKKSFEDCQGCPFKFNKIITVVMPNMQATFNLEKGFKYYLRVQAIGAESIKSSFSKTIQVELEN